MSSSEDVATEKPTLQVRGPADLVQLVPFLLGFHPDESLVLLGLRAGTVVVTVRIDLADLLEPADSGGSPAAGDATVPGGSIVLADTVVAMAGGGAQDLLAIVFDDRAAPPSSRRETDPLPWRGLVSAVLEVAGHCELTVSEALLVSRKRWWTYLCADPVCCPPGGQPLGEHGSAMPAAAAFAGLVALPDRAAVAALLAPEPDDRLAPALQAAEDESAAGTAGLERRRRSRTRALFAAARRADEPGAGPNPTEDELVAFGAALTEIAVRDSVWLAIDDGRLDGRELWRALGRRLPGRYAAAPMFLYGWASWRAGNGALAGIAADHALAADPECTAADLLVAALSRGIDPRRMPKLRQRSA